jgi:hypothetical protein
VRRFSAAETLEFFRNRRTLFDRCGDFGARVQRFYSAAISARLSLAVAFILWVGDTLSATSELPLLRGIIVPNAIKGPAAEITERCDLYSTSFKRIFPAFRPRFKALDPFACGVFRAFLLRRAETLSISSRRRGTLSFGLLALIHPQRLVLDYRDVGGRCSEPSVNHLSYKVSAITLFPPDVCVPQQHRDADLDHARIPVDARIIEPKFLAFIVYKLQDMFPYCSI